VDIKSEMRWLWVQFIYGLFISLFVSGYLIIYDPYSSVDFGLRHLVSGLAFYRSTIPNKIARHFVVHSLTFFIFRFENLLHHDFKLVSFTSLHLWVLELFESFVVLSARVCIFCMRICLQLGFLENIYFI